MRAVLILFTALVLFTAGCAPQQTSGGSSTSPAQGTPPAGSGAGQGSALAVKDVVGSWVSTKTMDYSGVQIAATLHLSLNATGSATLSAQAEIVGELFNTTGRWAPAPDGTAFVTEIEGTQSRGTLAGDELHWMNGVWKREQPAKVLQ